MARRWKVRVGRSGGADALAVERAGEEADADRQDDECGEDQRDGHGPQHTGIGAKPRSSYQAEEQVLSLEQP